MTTKSDNKNLALNYLKNQIISCEMPPGSVINIDEIAEKLGISKTPVREALLELQYNGYVDVVPRKKTTVSRISLQDLKNIYDARSLVETHIIRSFSREDIRSNQDILQNLRDHWANLELSNQSKDAYVAFLQEDLRFHQVIIQLSNNPHLIHFCQELIYKSQRFWYMALFNNDLENVKKEHTQIIDNLLKGQTEEAAACLQKHISVSKALSILSE